MQEGLSYLCSCSSVFPFCLPQTKQAAQPKASSERQAGADSKGKVKTLRNREQLESKGSEDEKKTTVKTKSDKSKQNLHLA